MLRQQYPQLSLGLTLVTVGFSSIMLTNCSELRPEQLDSGAEPPRSAVTPFEQVENPNAAIAQYQQIVRAEPENVEAYMQLGQAFTETGQPQAAIAAFQEAAQLDPDRAEVHFQLGQLYQQQEQALKAIAAYRQVTRLDRENASVYFNLGIIYKNQRNFNDAATAFNQALQLDPDYPGAQAQLTNTLYKIQLRNQTGAG